MQCVTNSTQSGHGHCGWLDGKFESRRNRDGICNSDDA